MTGRKGLCKFTEQYGIHSKEFSEKFPKYICFCDLVLNHRVWDSWYRHWQTLVGNSEPCGGFNCSPLQQVSVLSTRHPCNVLGDSFPHLTHKVVRKFLFHSFSVSTWAASFRHWHLKMKIPWKELYFVSLSFQWAFSKERNELLYMDHKDEKYTKWFCVPMCVCG